jgi:hypothetical protein
MNAAASQAEFTIARLWDITLDAIRDRDSAAVGLLRIIACHAPDILCRKLCHKLTDLWCINLEPPRF